MLFYPTVPSTAVAGPSYLERDALLVAPVCNKLRCPPSTLSQSGALPRLQALKMKAERLEQDLQGTMALSTPDCVARGWDAEM